MSDLLSWKGRVAPTVSNLASGMDPPMKGAILEAFDSDPTGMLDLTFSTLRGLSESGMQVADSIWLIGNLLAKFRGEGTMSAEMKMAAKDGYVARNDRAREIELPHNIRLRVRELLKAALPPIDEAAWRFGPGAVFEHLDAFERWRVVDPSPDPADAIAAEMRLLLDRAPSCRLCAVPKNAKKARLITVEPALASFWQQHLRQALLESVHAGPLKGTVEDLAITGRSEEIQRKRCLRASATGACSTLDLSDASDSIPWSEVQRIFPSWVVHDMSLCRSTAYQDGEGGREIFMYAGMGNASTFAVETLYFWAVFTACAEETFGFCNPRSISVFGDDIVLPSKCATNAYFMELIRDCGLVVNPRKSCIGTEPGFREACGLASFRGRALCDAVQVKGPYTMDSADISLCELVTRLDYSRCWDFHHLATSLIEEADLRVLHTPSPAANVDVVTTCSERPERGQIHKRWRSSLQLWEYRVQTRIPVHRAYRLHDLGPCQALAVLSGQVATRAGKRGYTEIVIDLPHQTRTASRWVRFYPDPTALFRVTTP